MKVRFKAVIDVYDIGDELAARGIEEGDCEVREAMFGTDYSNDCHKTYGLDWDLEDMKEYIERMEGSDYYSDYDRECAKLNYEIQKMLQEIFPDFDDILVDVSW